MVLPRGYSYSKFSHVPFYSTSIWARVKFRVGWMHSPSPPLGAISDTACSRSWEGGGRREGTGDAVLERQRFVPVNRR